MRIVGQTRRLDPTTEEPNMGEAYIIDAVRTPVGRRGGGLANEHPADLGAHACEGSSSAQGSIPRP